VRKLWILVLALLPVGGSFPAGAAPAGAPAIFYRYTIDSQRSRVSFTFRGIILPFDAHFSVLEGEISLGSRDPFQGASAWLRIEAGSIKSADPLQEQMLRDQVLDARRHPRIELRVEGARPVRPPSRQGREKDWEVRAQGILRLHGVERMLPLAFKLADTGTDLFVRGEGALRLSDFEMSRPTVLLVVPGSDVVEVNVRLVAHPAPPGAGS